MLFKVFLGQGSIWQRWRVLWRACHAMLPTPLGLGPVELARIVVGMALALLVTAWITRGVGTGVWTLGGWQPPTATLAALSGWASWGEWGQWVGGDAAAGVPLPWMIATMGASAMLVFATPAGPMAQPWPVLAGTWLAAIIGTLAQRYVGDAAIACAIAVGATVALMAALRCMHPPAAGLAALIVLEGIDGLALLWFPITLNIVVLLLCAWGYHAATGVRYPAWRIRPKSLNVGKERSAGAGAATPHAAGGGVNDADLSAALRQYGQVLDIRREDLGALIALATHASHARRWQEAHCATLMRTDSPAVEPEVSLAQAWAHMQSRQLTALPVVDAQRRVLGVLHAQAILAHWAGTNAQSQTLETHNTDEESIAAAAAQTTSATAQANAPTSETSTATTTGWAARWRRIVRRGSGVVGQVVGAVQNLGQNLGVGALKSAAEKSSAAPRPTQPLTLQQAHSAPVALCMDRAAPCLRPESALSAALAALDSVALWPIVDAQGHLLGVLHAQDVMRRLSEPVLATQLDAHPEQKPVAQ